MKLLFIIILFFQSLFAVGEAGGIFLLIPPGAMAQGMGEAMVANTNTALMSYYNPASISFSDKNRISATHVNWLPNLAADMYYQFVAFNYRLDERVSMGGHIIYLNTGQGFIGNNSPQTLDTQFMKTVAFSLAYKLSNASSVGFNIKTYKQKTNYIESKNNDFDFSYFKLGNKINFGIL